jgi:hypothetical protein
LLSVTAFISGSRVLIVPSALAPDRLMLAVMIVPHGWITTFPGEATLSRGLSHHRIASVACLGRALVAEH